ncbi:MAG: DUF4382 domain-containing protein [Gammaproteobacteria bacterium]
MTMPRFGRGFAPIAVLCALGLAGCNSGSGGGATGTMSLALADAPVNGAQKVVVTFTGVELQPANGAVQEINYSTPKQLDLLRLTGGVTELLLNGQTLPAGNYSWIRLKLDTGASYIVTSAGGQSPLTIPSGAQSGLKLNRGFTVPDGGQAAFTIDFDLRKSLTEANGQYLLRPTLRLVDNSTVGALSGSVSTTEISQCASAYPNGYTAAVYLFAAGATPTDINTSDTANPGPITTADVTYDGQTGSYRYTIPFIQQGTYEAAFTCDAGIDDPTTAQTLTFSAPAAVTITAGRTTDQNF